MESAKINRRLRVHFQSQFYFHYVDFDPRRANHSGLHPLPRYSASDFFCISFWIFLVGGLDSFSH